MTVHDQPTVTLRPLREDEFLVFRSTSIDGYADDMVRNSDIPPELARQKAEHDFSEILPAGLATAGHAIFTVVLNGESVGRLWIAELERAGRRVCFVYDVEIVEEQRGRGFGRQAMLLAEQEARARNLSRIEFNVFGGNAVARKLYLSLGYQETAIDMGKDLD